MSTNPYQSPPGPTELYRTELTTQRSRASQLVSSPAVALMVVSGISMAVLALAIPFDIFLLVSGAAQRLADRGPEHSITVFIRLIWDCVIFAASGYVFWGALQMKRLVNYSLARTAAIVACIPCVGPCCLLGIPFGAWALSVLGQPEVSKSFES